MANLAFCQHRLGRTDGVSLEVDKWRRVLEELGHTVYYLAGNDDVPGGHFIPELYPFHPVTEKLIKNCTRELTDFASPEELLAAIEAHKNLIKPQMLRFLEEQQIDLIFPNNLLSVGYNLAGMCALSEAIHETGVKAICHNHDFWWEDSGEVYPTCPEVVALYEMHAPPDYPHVKHVVINRIGQRALKERRGLDSTVAPNVFDFDRETWREDAYNQDFRSEMGIGAHDLVFLQATRILDRKAVELAIDVVAELQKQPLRAKLTGPLYNGRPFGPHDKLVLVCAGYVEGIGLSASYPENLKTKAEELGVDVRWVGERVKHGRGQDEQGRKVYSLWDSYVQADCVTYPSIWEGWGNQFIEAVFAKLPVVIFEYPVWTSDLAQVGFEVATLGAELSGKDARGLVTVAPERVRSAAESLLRYLKDPEARQRAVEKNFALAKEHFSLHALRKIIEKLLAESGVE